MQHPLPDFPQSPQLHTPPCAQPRSLEFATRCYDAASVPSVLTALTNAPVEQLTWTASALHLNPLESCSGALAVGQWTLPWALPAQIRCLVDDLVSHHRAEEVALRWRTHICCNVGLCAHGCFRRSGTLLDQAPAAARWSPPGDAGPCELSPNAASDRGYRLLDGHSRRGTSCSAASSTHCHGRDAGALDGLLRSGPELVWLELLRRCLDDH